MSTPERQSESRLLSEFQARYEEDWTAGQIRSMGEYFSMFPGLDQVARELLASSQSIVRRYRTDSEPGERDAMIGPYRMIRELGRGGQAVVYLAEDTEIERRVALKVLTGLRAANEDVLVRFRREAELSMRLDHPGICQVFETGMVDGVPYIAMHYVRGESLLDLIRAARRDEEVSSISMVMISELPEDDEEVESADAPSERGDTSSAVTHDDIMKVVELIEKVAHALHHAHEEGIVHRDVKPANIMVSSKGDPVVLDFGLAAVESPDMPSLTRTGQLFGTPAYMSPEQIAAHRIAVDRRTDIYSLGVTLFECITLSRPFDAPTREALYKAILVKEIPDPCKLNSAVPKELKIVLETATEKDPDRRYHTALDFAEDLRRIRKHEPIRARPLAWWLRLWRWSQRHPGYAAGILTSFVVLLLWAGYATWKQGQLNAALNDVERLADSRLLAKLVAEADTLWPPYSDKIGAYEDWLEEGADLASRVGVHRARLEALGAADLSSLGGEALNKAQWQLEVLDKLVEGLGSFLDERTGTVTSIRKRLAFAEAVERRTLIEPAELWRRTIDDIASGDRYDGLELTPQIGLIPLGRDRESQLHEFLHLLTHEGPIPRRDANGRIPIDGKTGVILVLVPAGSFWMGAQANDPNARNYDAWRRVYDREAPVHEVTLDAFFLAKHEVTQGQWIRAAGSNPSYHKAGSAGRQGDRAPTLRHPVELVTGRDCRLVMSRMGLHLPTEAQWEYSARAGTSWPYWTGTDPESLAGHINAHDLSYNRARPDEKPRNYTLTFDDGWVWHSPVGSFRPNPWGFHDILGNVWEWCRDWDGSYELPVEPGTGLRIVEGPKDLQLIRGGSFIAVAGANRVARRDPFPQGNGYENIGVRASCEIRR